MVRLTRNDINEYFANAAANLGASQMETQGAQVFQVPAGQTPPTQPDRKPAGQAPNGRTGLPVLAAAVRAACSLYNASPDSFVGRYLDFSEYTNSTSVADALMRQVCGAPPFPPAPGGADAGQPLPPKSPFTGGQCDDKRYRAFGTVNYVDNQGQPAVLSGEWFWTQGSGQGPIASVRAVPTGPTLPSASWAWEITDANGRIARRTLVSGDDSPGMGNFTFQTLDGSPDDCGDPPVEPGNDPTVPTPNPLPPFSFDPGDGGAPVTHAPEIAIEPGPTGPAIRFRFPEGDYYVDPGGVDVVAPDSPLTCCPPNAVPPDPETIQPDPEEGPPEPPPTGEPEPDPETEEEGRAIVAVVVTASNIAGPSNPIGGTDGSPTVYVPRLGSLQFLIEFGDGQTAWTGDIDIKTPQQAVPVEFPQGAVDVRVFAYGGTQFNVRRYYAAPQSTITEETS